MTAALSGVVEGNRHLLPMRVHYSHTDAGGVVYHAQYLVFADHARTELLRLLGWPFDRLRREHDATWVVRRATLDLKRPARLDDLIVIVTSLEAMRGASLSALQLVQRKDETLASLRLQLAIVNTAGRPVRIPKELLQDLGPYIDSALTSTFAAF